MDRSALTDLLKAYGRDLSGTAGGETAERGGEQPATRGVNVGIEDDIDRGDASGDARIGMSATCTDGRSDCEKHPTVAFGKPSADPSTTVKQHSSTLQNRGPAGESFA
jgi:hypothetical protein